MTMKFRVEQDGFGELLVPFDALYGAQTQRAVQNFALSGRTLPAEFLRALQETRRPHVFVWGQSGHGQRARLYETLKVRHRVRCARTTGRLCCSPRRPC